LTSRLINIFHKSSHSAKTILLIAFEDSIIIDEIIEQYPNSNITILTKRDISGKSVKEIVKLARAENYDLVILSNRNSQVNRTATSLKLLALASRGKNKLIFFDDEHLYRFTNIALVANILPRLLLGSLLGIYIYIKASLYFLFASHYWKKINIPPVVKGNKIAYLRTDLSGRVIAGGSLTHIKGFSSGARELGFEVIFHSDYPVVSEPLTIIIKPNKLLDFFDELQLVDYHFRFVRKAKKLFKKEKPDLIYQRHSIFNAAGIALSKYFSIPIILEVNNSEVWGKKNWSRLVFEKLAAKIENIAFRNANIVSVVSEITKEQIIPLGASEQRIVVNPNGVDVSKFSPDADSSEIKNKFNLNNKFVIGFIGTFTRWHGVEILFETAINVLSDRKNIVFLLIGDGNLKANLESKARELNIANKIIFTGIIPHEEAPKFLSACDILVSPHLGFETGQKFFGSPTKLFEYMAMGKPIIASDLEQIGKIIRHKVNGIKVKPGDVEELASAILDLIDNADLRSLIGANARKNAEQNYTWKMNAERVLSRVRSS